MPSPIRIVSRRTDHADAAKRAALPDTLLPRLISGELWVKHSEKLIEEAV